MERVSVLCLSLLLCSLSGAELQDNELVEQRKVSPESVNMPEPQPCPSDLHAVLQEMSVNLAENRLMIQQLQTLNQEQAAKLKEMDTHQQGSHSSGAVLVKNGEHVFVASQRQSNGYGRTDNGATLLLEAGNVVLLCLWQNFVIFDNEHHHSTFSGHLLFPM